MTTYSSEAELVAANFARIDRVQQAVREIRKQWDAFVDVHMESPDGDVQLSVNHEGRLMSLSLAPGCTNRYTNEALEQLISTTIQAAVNDANAEMAEIEKKSDEAALAAAELLNEL
ncbi:YbaB/EbfC family nucleoid-associated protein [Mycolicibacterium conceptionense]|uniref:YbaB/EbfC family nucleoid-associated protein n=1 Tax=Mycolicibacterium conceptionense TaxID=451644 RepID=UPI0032049306